MNKHDMPKEFKQYWYGKDLSSIPNEKDKITDCSDLGENWKTFLSAIKKSIETNY